ncbi:hypothetical protein THAOC_29859, partial [Thalassiosira oceanica]
TDAWEQVYRPAMGSWHHIPAGFEVCQAAQTNPKISAQKQGVAVEVEVDVGSQVSIVLLVVDRQRVRTNPDRSWHPMSSFTFLPFGAKVCPSFLPTKACNRTVALSRTNLVDRTLARTNGRGPSTRQGAQLDEAGQHSSPLCWPGPVSIVAKCAPEGVPSGHEEGEARQLKTNPTQSYPTKRPVQPISSNKPRDGRVGEKVCYVQCCGGVL